ncbi:MAG TPA: hypothetical protein VMB51_07995 [Solirubrobacteraceae bacterium]|nr:hypothetical protein [Solirubrobacteraceae bacterium]
MTRLKAMRWCLLAAAALSAIAAASAWAEAPEMGRCVAHAGGKYANNVCTKAAKGKKPGKYEWEPGAVKNKFTGVGGAATLETIHKVKVTCKAESSSGEFTSPKTAGNIIVKFTGCEALEYKCKSPGAGEGEIVVNPIAATLRWEDATKKKVAIDLVPQSGEIFVEFGCGPVPVVVRGSVMTNLPANKVETVFDEKFTAKVGKQKPEYYYTATGEKVQDVLFSKIGGSAPLEQAGQTITNTQTDEEALEVNTVA